MIRYVPKEYELVTGELSFSPGNILYNCYKCFKKKLPPKDNEIIDDQDKLKKATAELIKATKHEIREKKQKKFLKAISFGKLFVDGNNQGDIRNTVVEICQDIKNCCNISKFAG